MSQRSRLKTEERKAVWPRQAMALAGMMGVVVVAPGPGQAAAWNEAAGQGIVIADYTLSGGARYFNGSGRLSPAAAYHKQELIGYVQYGLTDWLTVIAKPSLSAISAATSTSPGAPTSHHTGLGVSEGGVQVQAARLGALVLAVQGSLRLPGTTSTRTFAMIGNTSRDLDLRGLAGWGFEFRHRPAFLDVEVGYRIRSGGAAGEWHVDATLGMRVRPRLLVLAQVFNVVCDGKGTAWFPPASSSKAGVALVYDVSARWSVEVGLFQTLLGVGALRERGVQSAVWYRF